MVKKFKLVAKATKYSLRALNSCLFVLNAGPASEPLLSALFVPGEEDYRMIMT